MIEIVFNNRNVGYVYIDNVESHFDTDAENWDVKDGCMRYHKDQAFLSIYDLIMIQFRITKIILN